MGALTKPLYQLAPEVADLAASFDELLTADGEIPAGLLAKIDALNLAVERKVQGCGQLALLWRYEADMIGMEIDRLAKLRAARTNAEARMKAYLMQCLEAMHVKSVKTDTLVVRIQGNGGVQPIEFAGKVEDLPERFQRKTVTFDVDAARKEFAEFGVLPTGITVKDRGRHVVIQ